MKKLLNEKVKFGLVALSFLVSSGSVLLIPFLNFDSESGGIFKYSVGIIFWLFLLAGIAGYFLLLRSNRKLHRSENDKGWKFGFIRPFKNRISLIIDICFLAALAAMFYLMKISFENQMINCISIFAVLFSFELHCLFSGMNFDYLSLNYGGKRNERPAEN